jgi:hypothetical protein
MDTPTSVRYRLAAMAKLSPMPRRQARKQKPSTALQVTRTEAVRITSAGGRMPRFQASAQIEIEPSGLST